MLINKYWEIEIEEVGTSMMANRTLNIKFDKETSFVTIDEVNFNTKELIDALTKIYKIQSEK